MNFVGKLIFANRHYIYIYIRNNAKGELQKLYRKRVKNRSLLIYFFMTALCRIRSCETRRHTRDKCSLVFKYMHHNHWHFNITLACGRYIWTIQTKFQRNTWAIIERLVTTTVVSQLFCLRESWDTWYVRLYARL